MGILRNIAVIDIGSRVIRMAVGDRLSNGLINIRAYKEIEYSGYENADFIDANEIAPAINEALSSVENTLSSRIKKVFVGVPAEFTTVSTIKKSLTFEKLVRINEKQINSLYAAVNAEYINNLDYVILNVSPIEYTINGVTKTITPIGAITPSIEITASVMLCRKTFVQMMDSILSKIGFVEVDYVSECLAISQYYFGSTPKGALVLDVGFMSTTLFYYRGEGIEYIKSFSLGSAYLAGDLYMIYDMPYEVADTIVNKKANIALTYGLNDMYEVDFCGRTYNYYASEINGYIKKRLDIIAECIKDCLSEAGLIIPPYLPMYIVGGGLSAKGTKEYTFKVLSKNFEVLKPTVTGFDHIYDSSIISLITVAAKTLEKRKGLLSKLLSVLGG